MPPSPQEILTLLRDRASRRGLRVELDSTGPTFEFYSGRTGELLRTVPLSVFTEGRPLPDGDRGEPGF